MSRGWETAVIAAALIAGFLIALLSAALLVSARRVKQARSPLPVRPGGGQDSIRQRLADEKARLEQLEAERDRRCDRHYERTTENEIIWGELLELELQDIDEQVSRICDAAGDPPRRRPQHP